MSVKEQLLKIKDTIPAGIKLVAVSKTKPVELIHEAYNTGHKIFGENRPQELKQKYEQLPKDIEWHFIGHLQSKQVKYYAPFVSLIHGVDSLKLLQAVNKETLKNNRTIDCLLEFHIAQEESKFGLNIAEAEQILQSSDFGKLNNIRICGVMGMATFTDNVEQIRNEFKSLKNIFDKLKNDFFSDIDCFKEISMGMSGDYKIAIEEGSTIVRIGSSIFGSRK
jgi:pyridoxal phosphate enzyme (YggS family)